MSAFVLNIDKNPNPQDVLDLFKKNNLSRGDKISVKSNESINPISGLIYLVTIINIHFEGKKQKIHGKGNILKTNSTIEELERQVEQEYGVSIALDIPDNGYENEHKEFLETAAILLGDKFEDEPDISHIKVKNRNPKFKLNE